MYVYIYIYIYIYMRVATCGAQMFGIFYDEKGVITCTHESTYSEKQVLSCRREHHFIT